MAVDSGQNSSSTASAASQQPSASPTTADSNARPYHATRHNITAPAKSDSESETETANKSEKEGKKKGPQNVVLYGAVRMSSSLCDGYRVWSCFASTLNDECNDWWVGA